MTKPNEEELNGLKEEWNQVAPDGFWTMPGGHAEYRREGSNDHMVLVKMIDHPMVEEAHQQICDTAKSLQWNVTVDRDVEMEPAWNPSPEESMMEQRMRLQEQLTTASCANPECEIRLAAMDLEDVVWTHLDDSPYVDDEGNETIVEIWSPVVTCFGCNTKINLAPEHYVLLAGDELASIYTPVGGGVMYKVLQREDVIAMVDGGNPPFILGTFCSMTNEVVPPFYRGLMVSMHDVTTEGEEE